MLIGIDASRANRRHKTGTEWYSYYLIRCLAHLDAKNKYILYTDKPLSRDLLNLKKDLTEIYRPADHPSGENNLIQKIESPYNNFQVKILKWPFKYFWTQGRLSLEMLFSKPDLLFVPAHALPLIHPKNSINTIHDVGFVRDSSVYECGCGCNLDLKNSFLKWLFNQIVCMIAGKKYNTAKVDYLNWSTHFALKNAKKIITVSQFSQKEILNFYGEEFKHKIKVVYNGYNNSLCVLMKNKKNIQNILNKYGVEGPYFFYLGRLDKKKNVINLVEGFKKFLEKKINSNYKLVLAGDGGFGYNELNYAIENLGLTDKIIMTGWIEEQDAPAFYSGAEAFIFPSLYEGFGIPIIQAMSCGTPVIASNAASLPEIAGEAALFFDPFSAFSLALEMEKIVVDKNLRNILIKRGFERARQFSWEKCARETLDIFNNSK